MKSIWMRVLVVATISIAIVLVIPNKKPRSLDSNPEQTPSVTFSTSEPEESKTTAIEYRWSGVGTDPYKIRIGELGIDAFVQKMGIDQKGSIAVPTNIHLAGWYATSAVVGTEGISVIVGHVTGKQTDGIFKRLDELKPEDIIEIERGDGKRYTYQVIESKQVKEAEAASYLFSKKRGVDSQLNLITCGGKYDEKKHQYEDRIIVYTQKI